MIQKEVHKLAVRLCEGDTVWINGLRVRAKSIPDGFDTCNECKMDSTCNLYMDLVCSECDSYDGKHHLLELVTKH